MKAARSREGVFMLTASCGVIGPSLFCAGWWAGYALGHVFVGVLAGLVAAMAGVLASLARLKSKRFYSLHWLWVATLCVGWAVQLLVFLMGVPVFCALVGLGLGIYLGRRGQAGGKLRTARLGLLALLTAVCVASATLALRDPYTASGIKGMLKLPFDVTRTLLWGLIVCGGTALLFIQDRLFIAGFRWSSRW